MRTSVTRHQPPDCVRPALGRPSHAVSFQSGARESGGARPTIPGFRACRTGRCRSAARRGLPGFEARHYRDFGQTRGWGSTGIPGMPLPGVGAQEHREPGHTRTGIPGMTNVRRTGIASTNGALNPLDVLAIRDRNSVFFNSRENTTTRGALFLGGVRR